MSCSSTTRHITSGEKHETQGGAGNFMQVGDKTYLVNYAGELIEITGSLITERAGKDLIGEGFKATASFTQFDPVMVGFGTEDAAWTADAQTGIRGYIQNVETGSITVITTRGYSNCAQQNFDETLAHFSSYGEDADSNAKPHADQRLQIAEHEADLDKANHEIVQNKKVSDNCIENGIERFKDKDFTYCISRFKSGYAVTYMYGASSIIYTEKTDDLKSFKQNCELSKFFDLVYNK